MNSIPGNMQISSSAGRQQSAAVIQKATGGQKTVFSGLTVPQKVSVLLQQLVQSSKETKAQEYAEHLMETGMDVDEDFQSELIDNTEVMADDEGREPGHRDGQRGQQEDEESEAFEVPRLGDVLPEVVAGGGIIVGSRPFSDVARSVPIPDNRVIALSGQNYYVAFLKRHVGNFASSSFANAAYDLDGISSAEMPASTPWGGASLAGSAHQFEAYIKATFPGGDPSVPANPPVKYDGGNLVVNGLAYGVNLDAPKLAGSVDSFLISFSADQQAEVQRVLHDFSELKIINTLDWENSDSSYLVSVPPDYHSQWRAALEDNLPAGIGIKYPARPYGGGFI